MNAQQVKRGADAVASSAVTQAFAKIGMGLLTVVLPWMGVTIWNMNTELAKISERVSPGVYTKDDARRDFALRDQKDREHDQRLVEDRTAINENRNRISTIEADRGPRHGGRL